MAKNIGKRTITVIRAPKVDRLSDSSSSTPSSFTISGCAIAPRSSFEDGKGWVTVDGYMVAAPFGSDIVADDKVKLPDGTTWDVDGAPGQYENKHASGKACIVYLKRVGS